MSITIILQNGDDIMEDNLHYLYINLRRQIFTLINKVPLIKHLQSSVTIKKYKLYPSIPETKQIKSKENILTCYRIMNTGTGGFFY